MGRDRIFALILAGFGAGILIRSFWAGIPVFSYFVVFLGAVFAGLFYLRKKPVFIFLAVLLLSFGFGIFRYDLKDSKAISDDLRPKIGKKVLLKGTIVDETDERENNTRLVVEAQNSGDKVLVFANRYPEFQYGDLIEINGKLQEVEDFADDFSWKAYLAKDDIFLQIFYPEIKKIESGHGFFVKRLLFSIKQKYLVSISRLFPEPHASFLGGLTVGARRAMPQNLLDDFRKVGLIHIVVLSGYNVTIVARSIAIFFGAFLPQVLSITFGLAGILFFAILTGASATVVRASIMASMLYLARATGRIYEATFGLFFAGFLMLLQNPKILRFDVSFQLSFIATLGLIFLVPRLEKYFFWLPKKYQIREHILATISAQIAVAPLILYTMGNLSLVALPVNALILLFIPATMFFGFLSGILGWIHNFVALPFAWISYGLLAYQLNIVEFFAGLPFAEIVSLDISLATVLIVYILLLWLFLVKKSPLRSGAPK